MEDIYYRIYDIFAGIRDTITDVADRIVSFATGVMDRVFCRLGWWVLHAILYRFCAHCQDHGADCSCCPRWVRAAYKIGQWLVGENS